MRRAVEATGSPDDIININCWMNDPPTGRAALNGEWVKMFPDPRFVLLGTFRHSVPKATVR